MLEGIGPFPTPATKKGQAVACILASGYAIPDKAETNMELLIGIGALISVIGIAGIVWSIVKVRRARKIAVDDAGFHAGDAE